MPSGKDFVLCTTLTPVHIVTSTLYRMDLALKRGGRVLWDYQGLKHEIPAEVIHNLIQLAEDYDVRNPAPTLDSIPKNALTLMWEQTKPLTDQAGELSKGDSEAAT
jgi:hypothetical protein